MKRQTAILVTIGLILVVVLASWYSNLSSANRVASMPFVVTRTLTATPTPEGLTYAEICARDKSLTDLQWNEHLKRYAGKTVSWRGWVNDVYKSGDGYMLYIAMESATAQIVPHADVKFYTNLQAASGFGKGLQIWFSGTLGKVTSFLGSCDVLELSDARVEKTSP